MSARVKLGRIFLVLSILCFIIAIGIKLQIKFPEKKFENYVEVLQKSYGITIFVDYCPEELKDIYTVEFSSDLDKINSNLSTIAECLEEIPIGLLKEICAAAYVTKVNDDYVLTPNSSQSVLEVPIWSEKDIKLILCTSIEGSDEEVGGVAISGNYSYYIGLVLGDASTMRDTFFHEFLHVLEQKSVYMLECGRGGAFVGWDEYNPADFKYSMNTNQYVMGATENKNDVYFISEYAKKNHKEDRAVLFEYLMSLESKSEFDELMQYPNLKRKIEFMSACIMEAYPSITEENCFQWQKWL